MALNAGEMMEENSEQLYAKMELFMNEYMDVPQLSNFGIKTVFSYYKEWIETLTDPYSHFNVFKKRPILEFIANKMVHSNFNDSEDVADFIQLHLETDPSFPVTLAVHTNPAECAYFVVYFMYHSHKLKRKYGNQRLSYRIYKSLILHMVKPISFYKHFLVNVLKHVIRYGGVLSAYTTCQRTSPSELLNDFLWDVFCGNLYIKPYAELNLLHCEEIIYTAVVGCMSECLKDLPQLDPNVLIDEYTRLQMKICNSRRDNIPGVEGKTGAMLAKAFECHILPNFDIHFTRPMSLKQKCRLLVRQILNDKWLLPHGIFLLPIPKIMQEYLDVQIL